MAELDCPGETPFESTNTRRVTRGIYRYGAHIKAARHRAIVAGLRAVDESMERARCRGGCRKVLSGTYGCVIVGEEESWALWPLWKRYTSTVRVRSTVRCEGEEDVA